MAIPVFVVGKHRSGTTWLANLLCSHSRVAGVQHRRHHGIHESAFFSCVADRYGDLAEQSNYIECVEVLSASDYFRLAGATREYLYSLWPTTYAGLFRAVMDRYAAACGATYWVEKTPAHSLFVDRIAELYEDALFVGIVRPMGQVVASSIALQISKIPSHAMNSGHRLASVVRTVVSWHCYNQALYAFARRSDRILIVEYERLESRRIDELGRICAFLGIELDEGMCQPTYAPNTSFAGNRQRERVLTRTERTCANGLAQSLRLVPGRSLVSLARNRKMSFRRPLPPWFFRLMPMDLERTLDEVGLDERPEPSGQSLTTVEGNGPS